MRRGHTPGEGCVGHMLPWIGLVLLSLGMGALFLDLEHRLYVWRMYLTLQPPRRCRGRLDPGPRLSVPRARRAGVDSGDLLSRWPALARLAERVRDPVTARWLGTANIAVGVALGIYTGILLSSLPHARSGQCSPRSVVPRLGSLPPARLRTRNRAGHGGADDLAARRHVFLVVELALIALFLIGTSPPAKCTRMPRRCCSAGRTPRCFWVFVVGLGIVLPLAIQSLMGHAPDRAHARRTGAGHARRTRAALRHRLGWFNTATGSHHEQSTAEPVREPIPRSMAWGWSCSQRSSSWAAASAPRAPFSSTLSWLVNLVAPAHAQANEYFQGYLGDGTTHPLKAWLVFEVIGLAAGALLSDCSPAAHESPSRRARAYRPASASLRLRRRHPDGVRRAPRPRLHERPGADRWRACSTWAAGPSC